MAVHERTWRIGEVATATGLTVRALHHYDQIGLLSPARRSGAGYRRYDDADLRRLQQILFYRELGFPLSEIADLVSDPGVQPPEHLRASTGCSSGGWRTRGTWSRRSN